jgi:hypothetical protein
MSTTTTDTTPPVPVDATATTSTVAELTYNDCIHREVACNVYPLVTAELFIYRSTGDNGKIMIVCEDELTARVFKEWFEVDKYKVLVHTTPPLLADTMAEQIQGWMASDSDIIVVTTKAIEATTIPSIINVVLTKIASYWRVVDRVQDYTVAINNKPAAEKPIIPENLMVHTK